MKKKKTKKTTARKEKLAVGVKGSKKGGA